MPVPSLARLRFRTKSAFLPAMKPVLTLAVADLLGPFPSLDDAFSQHDFSHVTWGDANLTLIDFDMFANMLAEVVAVDKVGADSGVLVIGKVELATWEPCRNISYSDIAAKADEESGGDYYLRRVATERWLRWDGSSTKNRDDAGVFGYNEPWHTVTGAPSSLETVIVSPHYDLVWACSCIARLLRRRQARATPAKPLYINLEN